jgi:hypothetical protein
MPPSRGTTSEDADIAGTNRSGCSAFARSSPKPKSLKPIHEGEEDVPRRSSPSPPHEANRAMMPRCSRTSPTAAKQSCPAARTTRVE